MLVRPPRECGGCAAKASPHLVATLVDQVRQVQDPPELLVGLTVPDDAAVQILDATRAIVTTMDVSPPLTLDPYVSGAVAAANAVNDVYAMGGKVLSALSLAAFPRDTDVQYIAAMMAGARDVMHGCGGLITGGHTVHSKGILFGLSVMGVVHPDRVWRIIGAQPGDVLVLSKPLGVGLAVTSQDPSVLPEALNLMQTPAMDAARELSGLSGGPHAVTDVTGYGLLGHLLGLVTSDITVSLSVDKIPLLNGVHALALAGWRTSAHDTNLEWVQSRTDIRVTEDWLALLVDPQTSGGLLAAIAPGPSPAGFWPIGHVHARKYPEERDVLITAGGRTL